MNIPERIARLEAQLVSTGRKTAYVGTRSPRAPSPELARLERGQYLAVQNLQRLDDRERHLARMLAVRRNATGEPVFSHESAAILLGMPLYDRADAQVHTMWPREGANSSRGGVKRHRSTLADDEIVTVGGLHCTSPQRTLFDLCRSSSIENAIASADGFLRNEFRMGRRIDEQRLGVWRDEMARGISARRGQRGIGAALAMLELADPRKDSVLESVSHLRLRQLGFEVALQVPVPEYL